MLFVYDLNLSKLKFKKGVTLLNLIAIIAIIGALIITSVTIYKDYISRAKIASLLSGINHEKIKLAEAIKKTKQVNNEHKIIIDTDHIVPESMLVLSPTIINDNVYWGCNRIGLSSTQVPSFCNLNDFTSPITTEINCSTNQDTSEGISYDNVTRRFNVNAFINGEVTNIGSFGNIEQAASSYLEFLN